MSFGKNTPSPGMHLTGRAGNYFLTVFFGFVIGAGLLSDRSWAATVFTTNTIQFSTYNNRTALLNGGWSFWATNGAGGGRNTEITDTNIGPALKYTPSDNPGALRIPVDTGLLLLSQNNTRNSLFRNLPTNWVSLRLKITFAPTQSFQEANLVVYQDDDNHVIIGHSFSGNERVRFAREFQGLLLDHYFQVALLSSPATDIYLRLDRDAETDRISGSYSLNGTTWTNVGNFSQTFSNPRLGICVGGSPGGFPNCDLIFLDVVTLDSPVTPAFVVPPQRLVFNLDAGQARTNVQAINVALRSRQSAPANWTLTNSAPTWLATSVTNGTTAFALDVSLKSAATNLVPGTYEAIVGFRAAGVTSADVNVTLIVNPTNRARVATWQHGKNGAMTVSVDDSKTSGYFQLLTNGFKGSFLLMEGTQVPVFTEVYQNGMELGAHTLSHPCVDVGGPTIRGEIEGNIAGILASTPMPQAQLISLAWPCGVASVPYQIAAADYFLGARGYNFNQLEETTPYDFMNLKSFNSHEHPPFPPADLKTLVDAAEAQGKWFNLVLHNFTNDDGAISYAAGKNVWMAPLGTVVKYIHQRDRTVITNYAETVGSIQFNTYRLPLQASAYRGFETAFGGGDVLTFQVDVTGIATVSAVFVAGVQVPFTSVGNTLRFQTLVTTNVQAVVLDLTSNTTPVLPAQDVHSLNELTTLLVTNTATDADAPAQTLNYTLLVTNITDGSIQTNAQISPNGVITWTPGETQGPGNYRCVTVVTDFATPPLSATNSFIVTVNEINVAPVLPAVSDLTLIGPGTVTVTNTATDADVPVNALNYALTVTNLGNNSAVLNASINAAGVITWTPTPAQEETTNRFTTVVTDTNVAAFNAQTLRATNSFVVTVRSYPLTLSEQDNQIVNELTGLEVTNTAALVPDLLTGWFATNTYLFNYPDRAALLTDGWTFLGTGTNGGPRDTEVTNPVVGLISYAQTNANLGTVLRVPCDQGDLWMQLNNTTNSLFRDMPTNWVSARLRLAFAPVQTYMQAHLVLYQDDNNYIEVGRGNIGSQKVLFIKETGGVPATLANPDVVGNQVTLRLDRDIGNGNISAFYSLNGTSWVSLGQTSQSLTNARLGIWTGASTLPYSTTQFRCDLSRLDIVVTNATLPLDYSLAVTNTADNSVVNNATIDAAGIINWTPNEAQGPGVYTFTTAVTNGPYAAQNTFTVTVNEVNIAPLLTVPANTNILSSVAWSALATAADADLPANGLTFERVSGPPGLVVAPTGLISWTPQTNQVNSTNAVLVRVTDSNPAAVNATSLSVTNGFTVVVAPLLYVTVNNTNRIYGGANPAFTVSYNGFVNGDNPSVLGGTLGFTTAATNSSPVGLYPIQAFGLTSSNYTIVFMNGTLSITPAPASVGLSGLSQTYSNTARVVTANTTPPGLNVTVTYAGSAIAPTNAGSYQVIGTLVETNYTGGATNTLIVSKHPLSVTAQNATRPVGQTNPVFTGSLIGVQAGDNITASYSSLAPPEGPLGNYAIIPTLIDPDLRLANYIVSVTNGVLTVVGLPRFSSITQLSEGMIRLQCEVYAGRTYEFHYKDALTEPTWIPFITNYAAVGSSVVITNTVGTTSQRFYRAVDVTNP